MKHKSTAIAAGGVLARLQECPKFAAPACAWLLEVRDGTGYSGKTQGRYADGLVCSLWPSRGIWLGGIEVKVSRSDWLKELADPTKSAAVQRYCDYWWVASPEGVVLPGEVPEQWGQLVVHPEASKTKRVVEAKAAPKLAREPWSPEFLASVMRSVSSTQEGAIAQARHRGEQEAMAKFDTDAVRELERRMYEAELKVRQSEQQVTAYREEAERLKAGIARFETDAGVAPGSVFLGSTVRWMDRPSNGALFKMLGLLQGKDVSDMAERFTRLGEDLRKAAELTKTEAAE